MNKRQSRTRSQRGILRDVDVIDFSAAIASIDIIPAYSAATAWSTVDSITPIEDFRCVQQMHSGISYDAPCRVMINKTTADLFKRIIRRAHRKARMRMLNRR